MGTSARITVAPRQSLGQNFLVDGNIVRKIVQELSLQPGDVVVEIGPGQGALTRQLAESGARVIAVEIDHRVIDELKNTLRGLDVEIIHQDFMETDLRSMRERFGSRLRIVGNIPYHLTSPILFKVFEHSTSVSDLTMMIQKEVARRITASPSTKEYGILSVFARLYGTPKILFTVSPECFYPKPKVTSAVLRLTLSGSLREGFNTELFRSIVRTTFGKRRKMIRNSMQYLPVSPAALEAIAASKSRWLDMRPEQLSVEDFLELTAHFGRIIEQHPVS
jgi:16S rRNA (adenine1518-N6/adenine1519-N6)-dimethyltransferase